ncbi:1-acyl-sn-glycerol-3-phosphate acyltransferase [Flavobacteriaceae bacterium]|nr:1-acyl-sn-glycerol-3-phosphate acyltransferase [Flavobacteriaceae bacterium]MDB4767696.1 1-acyl-sn-glycerol-3-phosphate acyltransferase [Flavobacteriaceae bacterium]
MQTLFHYLAIPFYRIWFYLITVSLIIIFSPALFVTTLKKDWYPKFYWMARNLWAKPILFAMGIPLKVQWTERFKPNQSYMLAPNHTSMLDIMAMLALSPHPFVFVGKKELTQFPIFGFFYKRVCILVDRDNTQSRIDVYRKAQNRLENGLSVCIFPEGGVPPPEIVLDRFKDGAFKMAISHQIPLVPIIFYDHKKLFPFEFFHGRPGTSKVKVCEFIDTKDMTPKEAKSLSDRVRGQMIKDLQD